MGIVEGMALVVGAMALFGALVWWANSRWPNVSPPPWDASLDEPGDDCPDLLAIHYPLDDVHWPIKDGVDEH